MHSQKFTFFSKKSQKRSLCVSCTLYKNKQSQNSSAAILFEMAWVTQLLKLATQLSVCPQLSQCTWALHLHSLWQICFFYGPLIRANENKKLRLLQIGIFLKFLFFWRLRCRALSACHLGLLQGRRTSREFWIKTTGIHTTAVNVLNKHLGLVTYHPTKTFHFR